MRCVIPGRSVKLFAKAAHCLSKIGEELYLEALPEGLAVRTVNLSRSAYACFMFHSSFFLSYDDGSKDLPEDSQAEDMLKCKIAMKSCLTAFKSMSTMEKSVDRCQIDLNVKEARLVFLFYCKHGITKTHNLTFQECESLQAVFTKDLCPNFITAQAKILSETVYNFPNSQDELSLTVTPEILKVKNYVEDEPDPNKVIHTAMTLAPEEFDNYQIGVDTEVTFCLKELRAILSFAEYANQPINIHFETGGKPIVFSIDGDSTYESDFVLATLVDQPPTTQSSQVSMVTAAKSAGNKGKGKSTDSQQNKSIPNGRPIPEEIASTSSSIQHTRKGPGIQERDSQSSQQRVTKQQGFHGYNDTSLLDNVEEPFDENEMHEGSTAEEESSKNQSYRTSNANKTAADMEDFFSDSFPYKDKFSRRTKKLSLIPEGSQENSVRLSFQASAPPIQTPTSLATDVSFLKDVDMPSLGASGLSASSCEKNNDTRTKPAVRRPDRDPAGDADESFEVVDEEDYDFVPGTPPSKKFKSMFFGALGDSRSQLTSRGPVLAADTDDEDSE